MRIRHGENDLVQLTGPADLAGYEETKPKRGRLIVGHSETGAHHTVVSSKARLYRKIGHDIAILVLPESAPLEHEGGRHETVELPPGQYSISVKRQYRPDGSWAPVAD